MTLPPFHKRCLNCKRVFGLKMYRNGMQEYPCHFKLRLYCSPTCASIANAAKRRAEKCLEEA